MKEYIWEFSASNSWIRFKVAYMQIGQISGTFLRFHGTVVSDDLFTHPEVNLVIAVKSVETLNPLCNETMLSDSFLAAAGYPHIIYDSVGGCRQSVGKIWELTGDLTVKAAKLFMTLVISNRKINRSGDGMTAFFSLYGYISRKNFGLVYPSGEKDISDEIQISADIVLNRKS